MPEPSPTRPFASALSAALLPILFLGAALSPLGA